MIKLINTEVPSIDNLQTVLRSRMCMWRKMMKTRSLDKSLQRVDGVVYKVTYIMLWEVENFNSIYFIFSFLDQ